MSPSIAPAIAAPFAPPSTAPVRLRSAFPGAQRCEPDTPVALSFSILQSDSGVSQAVLVVPHVPGITSVEVADDGSAVYLMRGEPEPGAPVPSEFILSGYGEDLKALVRAGQVGLVSVDTLSRVLFEAPLSKR